MLWIEKRVLRMEKKVLKGEREKRVLWMEKKVLKGEREESAQDGE